MARSFSMCRNTRSRFTLGLSCILLSLLTSAFAMRVCSALGHSVPAAGLMIPIGGVITSIYHTVVIVQAWDALETASTGGWSASERMRLAVMTCASEIVLPQALTGGASLLAAVVYESTSAAQGIFIFATVCAACSIVVTFSVLPGIVALDEARVRGDYLDLLCWIRLPQSGSRAAEAKDASHYPPLILHRCCTDFLYGSLGDFVLRSRLRHLSTAILLSISTVAAWGTFRALQGGAEAMCSGSCAPLGSPQGQFHAEVLKASLLYGRDHADATVYLGRMEYTDPAVQRAILDLENDLIAEKTTDLEPFVISWLDALISWCGGGGQVCSDSLSVDGKVIEGGTVIFNKALSSFLNSTEGKHYAEDIIVNAGIDSQPDSIEATRLHFKHRAFSALAADSVKHIISEAAKDNADELIFTPLVSGPAYDLLQGALHTDKHAQLWALATVLAAFILGSVWFRSVAASTLVCVCVATVSFVSISTARDDAASLAGAVAASPAAISFSLACLIRFISLKEAPQCADIALRMALREAVPPVIVSCTVATLGLTPLATAPGLPLCLSMAARALLRNVSCGAAVGSLMLPLLLSYTGRNILASTGPSTDTSCCSASCLHYLTCCMAMRKSDLDKKVEELDDMFDDSESGGGQDDGGIDIFTEAEEHLGTPPLTPQASQPHPAMRPGALNHL